MGMKKGERKEEKGRGKKESRKKNGNRARRKQDFQEKVGK